MGANTSKAGVRKVILVDDHPVVRHGMSHIINKDSKLEVVGEAASAVEGHKLIEAHHPDALVVDITLGGVSGLEFIKQVKAKHPSLPILVASMHDEQVYGERALRAGAMGYLNKQEAIANIVQALHQILGGAVYVSARMTDRMLHRMIQNEDSLEKSPIDSLSDRELEVFELIGKGLTTRQIAETLSLSPKTIETHRDHIKTKLDISNNNELVRVAVEWMLEEA